MYELSRVRLHAVGPKGARYQDVTLDLRRSPSSQPSGASVLFLENGGGKTVLVRLIFSVILPGRRQVPRYYLRLHAHTSEDTSLKCRIPYRIMTVPASLYRDIRANMERTRNPHGLDHYGNVVTISG